MIQYSEGSSQPLTMEKREIGADYWNIFAAIWASYVFDWIS